MEKIVKTRKPHKCNVCHRDIPIGEQVTLYEEKGPRYDEEDRQIGISYWRGYICLPENHDMEVMEREYGHFTKPQADGDSTAT